MSNDTSRAFDGVRRETQLVLRRLRLLEATRKVIQFDVEILRLHGQVRLTFSLSIWNMKGMTMY